MDTWTLILIIAVSSLYGALLMVRIHGWPLCLWIAFTGAIFALAIFAPKRWQILYDALKIDDE